MDACFEKSKATNVKRHSLNLQQRIEILERLKKGAKNMDLCKEFNVSHSTISKVKKNENETLRRKKVIEECDGNLNTNKYRAKEETEVEKQVFHLISENRQAGVPITGLIIQTTALEVNNNSQEIINFKASAGWLRGFKKRHSLRSVQIHGEKLSANVSASDDFKNTFPGFIDMMDVPLDNIYNCDETGLYWKLLPNRTYVLKDEKTASGRKESKNRVTLMTCTNASGTHKVPLLVIGKSAKPRCFKNVKQLPLYYASQRNSWMDRNIFNEWFTNCFLSAVKEKHDYENNPNLKIILLMDNAPCHPPVSELEKLSDFCTVICFSSDKENVPPVSSEHVQLEYENEAPVSFLDACNALNTLKKFVRQNENSFPVL